MAMPVPTQATDVTSWTLMALVTPGVNVYAT